MSSIIDWKLRKFVGKYNKIHTEDIYKIINSFKYIKRKQAVGGIIKDLENLKNMDYITISEIWDIFMYHEVKADIKRLWVLLLRESKSLHKISYTVIKEFLIPAIEQEEADIKIWRMWNEQKDKDHSCEQKENISKNKTYIIKRKETSLKDQEDLNK